MLKERLLALQEKLAERERGEVERRHAVKYRKVSVCQGIVVNWVGCSASEEKDW